MTYRDTYLAGVFIVDMAITDPIIPIIMGKILCQQRSDLLSECLAREFSHVYTRNGATDLVRVKAKMVVMTQGGAHNRRVVVKP